MAQTDFACRVGLAFKEVRAHTFGGMELPPATVAFFLKLQRADVLLFYVASFGIREHYEKQIQREKEIL
ncbi:hypothetical protein [Tunturiibacter psychrotolerans]|uniref:hypothetical protein n=1 Tax=Tunturiibacter psychrotolerans TaxID=3069686 RepID=UPI003D1E9921